MRMITLVAAILLFPNLLLAADAPKSDGKFVSLFDGKTLAGWKVENCKVEVQDGCIFLKGGNGWVRTEKTYGDFVLELDWKALKKEQYDSGVFIRAVPPVGNVPVAGAQPGQSPPGPHGQYPGIQGRRRTNRPRQAGRVEPFPTWSSSARPPNC